MMYPGAGQRPPTPQVVIVVVAKIVKVPVPGRVVHMARDVGKVPIELIGGESVLPLPMSGAGGFVHLATTVGVSAQL